MLFCYPFDRLFKGKNVGKLLFDMKKIVKQKSEFQDK